MKRYPYFFLLQADVTALMIAVFHGHSHIVEVLTRFKPVVNLQTKVGVVTYCSGCCACVSCAVTCVYKHGVVAVMLIFMGAYFV